LKRFSGLRINRDQTRCIPSSEWLPLCYPAAAVFVGLLAAQVIATFHVYFSNQGLYQTLSVIRDAGYLVIPNHRTMNRLQEFAPAFYGGLFFTFSVGAGLSLISIAAAWAWDRLFSRTGVILILLLLLWVGSITAVNWKGFSPLVTAYFSVIPAVVFFVTLRWMPSKTGGRSRASVLIHLMTIALLGSLWVPQLGDRLFLDIRDRLLLSNPLGIMMTDFYYRYTLYPAHAFKSLDQQTLKTCSLHGVRKKSLKKLLQGKLISHDYLDTEGKGAIDLKISESGRDLIFENRGRGVLRIPPNDFLSRPAHGLKRFSSKTDRYLLFRQFTFYSILIGFPITLYLFLVTIFLFLLTRCLDLRTAPVAAAILCLISGISLLIPIWLGNAGEMDKDHLNTSLESGRWQERVAALKTIREKRMEVSNFSPYKRMLSSPHIAERYWLTKALGVSRRPETYKDLLGLLNDPSPIVVSMAFQALGRRGDRQAVKEILKRIKTSNDWYNQWYAYKALRALGWKQIRLKRDNNRIDNPPF